jgi:hypothetical protein
VGTGIDELRLHTTFHWVKKRAKRQQLWFGDEIKDQRQGNLLRTSIDLLDQKSQIQEKIIRGSED